MENVVAVDHTGLYLVEDNGESPNPWALCRSGEAPTYIYEVRPGAAELCESYPLAEGTILEVGHLVLSSRQKSEQETVHVQPSSRPSYPSRDPEAGMADRDSRQKRSVAREGGESAREESLGSIAELV